MGLGTVRSTEKLLGRAGSEYVYLNVSVWTWLFILLLNVDIRLFILLLNVDSHEWRMPVFTQHFLFSVQ